MSILVLRPSGPTPSTLVLDEEAKVRDAGAMPRRGRAVGGADVDGVRLTRDPDTSGRVPGRVESAVSRDRALTLLIAGCEMSTEPSPGLESRKWTFTSSRKTSNVRGHG